MFLDYIQRILPNPTTVYSSRWCYGIFLFVMIGKNYEEIMIYTLTHKVPARNCFSDVSIFSGITLQQNLRPPFVTHTVCLVTQILHVLQSIYQRHLCPYTVISSNVCSVCCSFNTIVEDDNAISI